METPSDWRRVRTVFLEAVDLPTEDRDDFLNRACGTDTALRAEVDALLSAHDTEPTQLDEGNGAKRGFFEETVDAGVTGGQLLGNYRIKGLLGRGGMATAIVPFDLGLERRGEMPPGPA